MSDYSGYLEKVSYERLTELAKCKLFIYFKMRESGSREVTIESLLDDLVESGLRGAPNKSRLVKNLNKDKELVEVVKGKSWRLTEAAFSIYDQDYSDLIKKKYIRASDSVVPLEIVEGNRSYIEKIAGQVNACYDGGCFDASLVMMRKLLEVCLIETFESKNKGSLILNPDGDYLQLSGITNKALDQNPLGLTRNNKKFLKERNAKKQGDLAAHNPRYVAVQQDIDNIKGDFRVIIQELIFISGI